MDTDGMQTGYDLPMTRAIADAVNLPVIASGGAGSLEDLYDGIAEGHATSLLVASIVHFGIFTIRQIKEYLAGRGLSVRLE
jgi:cyclase